MRNRQLLITEDGSHTLIVPELKETYHSTHGAIRESKHVFIREGLQFYCEAHKPKAIKIFELGFGTGLNTLLTALYAEKRGLEISYDTIEAFPLAKEIVNQLNYASQLEGRLAESLFREIHAANWDQSSSISNHFVLHKIADRIEQYILQEEYDICYFDAFAPSKQPEMWEVHVLEKIRDAMKTNGVFVTYCAQGQLKRNLRDIGFEVSTLQGPPGKKEMVRAIKI